MHTLPAVQMSSNIDHYLSVEGAIAQAVDARNILLSSQCLRLPSNLRALVIAHEVAHTRQLARPGSDPGQFLEEEAWEAAHAWLQGRPFRIQGRARGRLNAAAILDRDAHPYAESWYKLGEKESIGNSSSIKVDSVHSIKGMTLESLLDKMLELSGTKEFVVVCHGNQLGLQLPLTTGAISLTDTNTLGALATDRGSEEEGPAGKVVLPAISDEKVRELAMIKDAQHIVRLRIKMNKIRARGLRHIAFRACNMGTDKNTLKIFNTFFQAASVSAPAQPDSYGTFTPGTPLPMPELKKWAAGIRLKGFSTSISDDVALGTKKETGEYLYYVQCRPATKTAMAPWVKKHIIDNYRDSIVYHAIFNRLLDPQVSFVRDQQFIDSIVYVPR